MSATGIFSDVAKVLPFPVYMRRAIKKKMLYKSKARNFGASKKQFQTDYDMDNNLFQG
jgi:hypothetical protein